MGDSGLDETPKVIRHVVPAGRIPRSKYKIEPRRLAAMPDCGLALTVRYRREELRAQYWMATGGGCGSSAFQAEMALGTRLLSNLNACHVTNETSWADPRNVQALLGTHVSDGTAQAMRLGL